MSDEVLILLAKWGAILFCISQSAIFSGLNLAFFSISKLRLKIEKAKGNRYAGKILSLREQSNFLLTTILWGNVGINVLLALISESVLTGISAFLFSTIVITILGEIIPQAFFSRHAIKVGARLSPVIQFYQILLYPVSKPSAMLLDLWLGPESISFFQENDLRQLIKVHIASEKTDIDHVEGMGVLNFLALDDVPVSDEGEIVHPASIISMDFKKKCPVFPEIKRSKEDPFIKKVMAPNKKWIILTNRSDKPIRVLDADSFLRGALFDAGSFNPDIHCHSPITIQDETVPLGDVIINFKNLSSNQEDDVIDQDIILVWNKDCKRVITGADILGRLLRGIAANEPQSLPEKGKC